MTVNRRALESAALAGQPKRQASDHQTMKPPMGQFSGPVEMTATYALSLIHAYPAK